MIYQISLIFYDIQKTYYASSHREGYEMFKTLGTYIIRTTLFVRGKMYERREGEVRTGVYYSGAGKISKEIEITMQPYRNAEPVETMSVEAARNDLKWIIFNKEINDCTYGYNDLRHHYGNKYDIKLKNYKL